jgi:hypothetical protein
MATETQNPNETKFAKGDRVAWSRVVAPEHEPGNVIKLASVHSKDPMARTGTIVGNGDPKSHYVVAVDALKDSNGNDILVAIEMTLTAEELVKIVE